ncbi:MAG: hypothetical protein ACRD04_06390 [Terriglobales bacterium]
MTPLRSVLPEVTAIAILALAGVRVARSFSGLEREARASRQLLGQQLDRNGTALYSLAGVDVAGAAPVNLAPGSAKEFVLFLVRPASARVDLGIWVQVERRFVGSQVRFEGYCEHGDCAAAPLPPTDAVLLQAGQVRAVQAVLQADRGGAALLVSHEAEVVAEIPWRGRGPSATARAIAAASLP